MKYKETLYTIEDCIPLSKIDNFEGRVFVLRPSALGEKYRIPQNQIWKDASGFGCDVHKIGTAVFGICMSDGEYARWQRANVLGVLKDELIPTEGIYEE